MATRIALLRGINVGGRHKVAMADLRDLLSSLGATGVRTYVQSGNVVFDGPATVDAAALEAAFVERFGFEATFVLRTAEQVADVLAAVPFDEDDPAKVHVGFLAAPPPAGALAGVGDDSHPPERFVLAGEQLYLHLPLGAGRAKLPALLERRLGVPVTYRNRRTVEQLVELARSGDG